MSKAATGLVAVAARYAAARTAVETHDGPPQAPGFATVMAQWRDALLDLDRAAKAAAVADPKDPARAE